jgi:transposase
LAAYRQGPEAVGELVVELAEQLGSLAARVAALEADNATLRARLDTDSHNSSKPPSSDRPGGKPHPKSQRRQSGRQAGAQPGHRGHTLQLVDDPDEVQVHTPACCQICGQSLEAVAAVRRERRQVVDIPPIQRRVVEHQVETKCCPRCGVASRGEFPAGLEAPAQYGPGVATLAVYFNQEQLLPEAPHASEHPGLAPNSTDTTENGPEGLASR